MIAKLLKTLSLSVIAKDINITKYIQGRQVETRRQVAKQNVGKPEAKLEVDRIWLGPPDSDKKSRGHHGLSDDHTDEDLEVSCSMFLSLFSYSKSYVVFITILEKFSCFTSIIFKLYIVYYVNALRSTSLF